MDKTFLVFGKELRVMYRDRRLVLGVAITSLVVMPVLMGLIGNLDRLTGSDAAPVDVLVEGGDTIAARLFAERDDIRLHRDRTTADAAGNGYLTLLRDGATYRVYTDGTDSRLAATAREIRDVLDRERRRVFEARLAARGLTTSALDPFTVEIVDMADEQARSRLVLGVLVPYLVIILLVSNAIRAV
jgi:hypothetical protein